ncbi:MAG: hypothetical protein ABDK92_03550 [Atribacterota bacterium]
MGLKVKDTCSGKEWVFQPNRWLALGEGDRKTYGEFTPLEEVYPAGILVEGNRNSLNLIEVSDTVFILPQGCTQLYFTCFDGTREMEVFRENGRSLGKQYASASRWAKRVPPCLPKNEWGVPFDTTALNHAERFLIRTRKGQETREKTVWIFPPNWANYQNVALKTSILYSLKGKTEVFSCGTTVKNYLAGLSPNVANAALPVINYGVDAFSIFGASPDSYLEDSFCEFTRTYLENQKTLFIQRFGFSLELVSSAVDLFEYLYDALNWALQLPGVVQASVAQAYKVVLLKELGANDKVLAQIAALLEKGKELAEEINASFEANDPYSCAQKLSALKTLTFGNNPLSNDPQVHSINYGEFGIADYEPGMPDHPLAILFSLATINVKDWRKNGHPLYRGDELLSILLHDPVTDTNAALDVYEPLLRTIIQAGGILTNVCLLGSS